MVESIDHTVFSWLCRSHSIFTPNDAPFPNQSTKLKLFRSTHEMIRSACTARYIAQCLLRRSLTNSTHRTPPRLIFAAKCQLYMQNSYHTLMNWKMSECRVHVTRQLCILQHTLTQRGHTILTKEIRERLCIHVMHKLTCTNITLQNGLQTPPFRFRRAWSWRPGPSQTTFCRGHARGHARGRCFGPRQTLKPERSLAPVHHC